jgi:hypothetical protein
MNLALALQFDLIDSGHIRQRESLWLSITSTSAASIGLDPSIDALLRGA